MTLDKKRKSVKGKFLSEFQDIVKEIDMSIYEDLDISKIKAGSNKIILDWVCVYCKETYKRNVNSRVRSNCCCPKKECMLLKRSKTNNENFGWIPRYHSPKRDVPIKKVPEPAENDLEAWKDLPIELLLSRYEISNLGRLKNKKQLVLTQKPGLNGYVSNSLYLDDGTYKTILVHRLVAKTFLVNIDSKPTVNHINKNRSDNRVINLEWATYTEQAYKENKNIYFTRGKSINQYDLSNNFIKKWDKAIDVERELKINRKNILKVLKGERKQTGGFAWKYSNVENITLEDEIWKECPLGDDFTRITVSTLGRIKFKDNIPSYGYLRKNGYYDVKVLNNKEKKHKTFRVHRLVCLTFLENPENKPIVNHKDENRSNNKLENLEWMTNKENVNYSLDINNRIKQNKRSKVVIQIDPNTKEVIKEYNSISSASKETKINNAGIWSCCESYKGRTSAGGFLWSYK